MCNLCCLGLLSTSSVYSCMVGAQSNAMFVSLDFKLYTWNVKESSKSLEICIFEIFHDMIWFAQWWFLTLVNQQSRPKTEKNSTTFYADFKKVSKKFLTTVTKGQIKPKADWRAVDSPKKQTDEFDLFAVKSKKANKSNLSIRFLGELADHKLLSK